MRLRTSAACGLIFCSIFVGPAAAVEPGAPEQLITRLDAVGVEVQKRLSASFRAGSETGYEKIEHGALVEYYADHSHSLVWVDGDGLTDRARAVMRELARAEDYGLKSKDYALPKLEAAKAGETLSTTKLAEAELKFSHAVLAYVRDARGGRMVPGSISRNLDPTLNLPDPLDVMEKIAEHENPAPYLVGFHPQHPQFEALRKVLLQMRGGVEEKKIVIPAGPLIRPGGSHKQIALLRQRLKVPAPTSDDTKKVSANKYDPELVAAVKAFQKSRGLNAEGIVGPATRRALNSRPRHSARTILANMERWRWLPDDTAERLNVQVNVPEFTMRVFEGLKPIHTERVVVGKTKNATPIFSDQMETIVFHPYWNVPNSIKVKEILPNLRRNVMGGGWFGGYSRGDARFLRSHGLHIKYKGRPVDPSSVNWSNVDIRRYHFYQKPGGGNVLGVVKFMFPNKHAVYMHDTPTKHLFAKPVRAYSHGCMRIRNPQRLAEIILARDSGWSKGRVSKAVQSKVHRPVGLKKPVPVHVTYFTARVLENGKVRYFSDLYGHDTRMAKALKF